MTAGIERLIHELGGALRRNSRADSASIVRKIIRAKPPLGVRWKSMAAIAQKNGEVEDAQEAMKYYCEAAGGGPSVQYEMAALCAQLGRLVEADRILAGLPRDIPTAADYHYSSGTLALNLGRIDEARQKLKLACEAAPASGQSWLALAMAGPLEAVDRASLLDARRVFSNSDPIEQSAFAYACGKALDETGEYDEAYRCFAHGADAMRKVRTYEPSVDMRNARESTVDWLPIIESEKQNLDRLRRDVRQIFVTGLPRSGTTLVEQILNSHSEVMGGEELGIIKIVTQDIGNTAGSFRKFQTDGGTADQVAAIYDHLLAQRGPRRGRFVDKSLDTSRYIGLIATIFSNAPIIWLRRDPIDCAWSSFRTWFLRGLEWSWSPADIAQHFATEDALFHYWRKTAGDQLLSVQYSDLVQNPAIEIERITQHCKLTMQAAQLRPHETARPVKTASVTQVRQPIHANAIGNAKPYKEFMEQFEAAYDVARASLPSFG
jgi:Sulfotransferase family